MNKFLFSRNIVYIGANGNDAIYFDRKKRIALKAPFYKFFPNMAEDRQHKLDILLCWIVAIVCLAICFLFPKLYFLGYELVLIYVSLFLGALSAIILMFVIPKKKYGNIKQAKLATREEFSYALKNSCIWGNKPYRSKKMKIYVLVWIVIMLFTMFLAIDGIKALVDFANNGIQGLYKYLPYYYFGGGRNKFLMYGTSLIFMLMGIPLLYYFIRPFNVLVLLDITFKYRKKKLFKKKNN